MSPPRARLARRLALVAFAASQATLPARAADLDALVRSGRLRVIVERSDLDRSAAFAHQANAFERDVLEGFASLHRLKVELVVVTSFRERITALLRDRGDVIGGLVVTPERRRQVEFSEEVFPVRHVVVNRPPARPILTLSELRAARVGTVPATSWAEEIAAAGVPAAHVDASSKDPESLLAALLAGRVEAIVLSTRYAILARLRQPELQLGLMLGRPSSVAYAVRSDQPALRTALDQYVVALRRTPAWSQLVVKYFGAAGLEVLQRARQE